MTSESHDKKSLLKRTAKYYAKKTSNARKDSPYPKKRASWEGSGASLRGAIGRSASSLDLPFKSLMFFVGSAILLSVGWTVLIVFGVAFAGSVWSISATIPSMFIITYAIMMINGTNMIRELAVRYRSKNDSIVSALFRGYFWSLLSIGFILLVHRFFLTSVPHIFNMPIVYFIPIEVELVVGGTIPVPVPLGMSGWYIDIISKVLVFVIGIVGACIGGLEILEFVMAKSSQNGIYGAIFNILFLASYPAFNLYFSISFLDFIIDLYWRFPLLVA